MLATPMFSLFVFCRQFIVISIILLFLLYRTRSLLWLLVYPHALKIWLNKLWAIFILFFCLQWIMYCVCMSVCACVCRSVFRSVCVSVGVCLSVCACLSVCLRCLSSGVSVCPGKMTTHAESINSDIQHGLDRRLRHTQHWTQNRTS